MIGAPYEFDRGNKTKEFSLFSRDSQYTDDSVMTIAVAEALMDSMGKANGEVKTALVAISLGGDCDTLTCIAGGIAEAFYGVSDIDKLECKGRLPEDMLAVIQRFDKATGRKK